MTGMVGNGAATIPLTALAVANCVSGPRSVSDWIIEMFRPFVPTLEDLPGFHRFYLRELVQPGADCMYVSLSFWEGVEHFEAWRQSDRFVTAHATAEADRARFARLNGAKRYDFPAARPDAPGDLDAAILARIGADYARVDTAGAQFRDVITASAGHA